MGEKYVTPQGIDGCEGPPTGLALGCTGVHFHVVEQSRVRSVLLATLATGVFFFRGRGGALFLDFDDRILNGAPRPRDFRRDEDGGLLWLLFRDQKSESL